MKNTIKLAALASVALLGLAANSQAALLQHNGSITGSDQVGSVDYFRFETTSFGNIRIETFAPTFDSVLWLFRDDGDLTRNDRIASNDDGGTLNDFGFRNSRLSGNIAAGSYITAVGDFRLTLNEAIAGINNSASFGVGLGDYRLEVEGEFVQASASSNVSEPLTLSLFGLALAGFGAFRRKKS